MGSANAFMSQEAVIKTSITSWGFNLYLPVIFMLTEISAAYNSFGSIDNVSNLSNVHSVNTGLPGINRYSLEFSCLGFLPMIFLL